MPQLFYGHIMVDGVRINYYRTGGEKPPVILLHGITDNGLCWNRVALTLEVEFDVLMMDARGHGSSGLDERGASPEVQADDVLAVIETLGLKRPVLIGHSMGAEVAALAAARSPKVVRGLVLEDPPWREPATGDGGNGRSIKLADLRTWLAGVKSQSLDAIIAFAHKEYPTWDESEYFQWAKAKQRINVGMLDYLDQPRPPYTDIVRKITCPGLLLYGDIDLGALISPHTASQISRLWRKAKLVHIPAAGHNIRREKYGAYIKELAAFLRKLPK